MHTSTLRHRYRRIEEILGLRLDDAQDRAPDVARR